MNELIPDINATRLSLPTMLAAAWLCAATGLIGGPASAKENAPAPRVSARLPRIGIDLGPVNRLHPYQRCVGGVCSTGIVTSTWGTTAFYGPPVYNGIWYYAPGHALRFPSAYWRDRSYLAAPRFEPRRRVDPASGQQPVRPQTPTISAEQAAAQAVTKPDEGLEALRTGAFDRAAAIYQRRAEEQTQIESGTEPRAMPDRSALRLAGLAHAGAGRFAESMQAFARAMAEDESLQRKPLDGPKLLGSRSAYRAVVTKAVRFAQKGEAGPDGWDYVALLMDAEGRTEAASRMRERAEQERARAASKQREQAATQQEPSPKPDSSADSKPDAAPREKKQPGPASFRTPETESAPLNEPAESSPESESP